MKKNKQAMLCFIIIIISLLFCFILKKNGLIVSIFSLLYITVIYIRNFDNVQKFLYYSCLFFAIVTLGHKTNYFLTFVMYVGTYIYKNYNMLKDVLTCKGRIKGIIKNLNKYKIFLIVFVLYSLASVIWAINKGDAIKYLLKYFIGITLLIIIVLENKTKEELKGTFKLLIYTLLGILCIGTAEICGMDFGLPNHYEEHYYEDYNVLNKEITRVPVTFFNNPNDNAYFLVIGVALMFYAIYSGKSKKSVLLSYIVLVILTINLIFSRSRTGLYCSVIYLILILGLGIINYKHNRNFAKKSIVHSVAFIVVIVGILHSCAKIPKLNFYTEKFITIASQAVDSNSTLGINTDENKITTDCNIQRNSDIQHINNVLLTAPQKEVTKKNIIGEYGSNNTRITLIYDVVVKGLIEEKNYFGVGAGNSFTFLKKIGNTHGVFNVHSMWFEVLCDFGLGIFIYLIYIYCSLIYDVFRLKNKNEFYTFALGICCVNVILVFGPSSVIHYSPFWILLGLIYAIKVYGQNEQNKIK